MRSFSLLGLIGWLITMAPSCQQPDSQERGVSFRLAEKRKSLISNLHYQLDLTIPEDPAQPVHGVAVIYAGLNKRQSIALDFKQSPGSVHGLRINGRPTAIHHIDEHILLPAEQLTAGSNTIEIGFTSANTALNRNNDYMYTLFVPDRARTVFPCFDQPDLKAVFELSLRIPAHWQALSNGPLIRKTTTGGNSRWQFAASDTISTYLFAFTAGRYELRKEVRDGRQMQLLYRETDTAKLAASMDTLFDIHAAALQFMEDYTGISYPFRKFDFVAIPDFQFGGMEHPGAIWYNAGSLFLDSSATRAQLTGRANLLGHETAHMWFGDLVTMKWFNDVWMKEVFANFMADKITAAIRPADNADLQFITTHYPAAYSVDRTSGANPIRQPLDNLDEAGTLYGDIIYHKAPIMMQQLEKLTGPAGLREGLQEYLGRYAFGNADWPQLIEILDRKTNEDLKRWNDSWVNGAGRPVMTGKRLDINHNTYGLFEIDTAELAAINEIPDARLRALTWLNLYENVLEGRYVSPAAWLQLAVDGLHHEKEELILQMLLNEMRTIYWTYLPASNRSETAGELAPVLLELMERADQPRVKKIFFNAWVDIMHTGRDMDNGRGIDALYRIWISENPPEGVLLSSDDYTRLAAALAIGEHPNAASILKEQSGRLSDPDKQLRWKFLLPALSADEAVRDNFFASLRLPENRKKEAWVNTALGYLHHPLRENSSVKYIRPSLEMLEEIRRTGDIFFPLNWLRATLSGHQSAEAAKAVQDFIDSRPQYDKQLRSKLLQAADPLFRARKIMEDDKH